MLELFVALTIIALRFVYLIVKGIWPIERG